MPAVLETVLHAAVAHRPAAGRWSLQDEVWVADGGQETQTERSEGVGVREIQQEGIETVLVGRIVRSLDLDDPGVEGESKIS